MAAGTRCLVPARPIAPLTLQHARLCDAGTPGRRQKLSSTFLYGPLAGARMDSKVREAACERAETLETIGVIITFSHHPNG